MELLFIAAIAAALIRATQVGWRRMFKDVSNLFGI